MEPSIKEAVDINYLRPDKTKFYKTPGGFLGVIVDGKDYKRIETYRCFPIKNENKYISIRTFEEEIGIIEDLNEFPPEQRELIEEELEKRYFMPKILSAKSIKEEFGYSYWDVTTDRGDRNFTVHDISSNMIVKPDGSIILMDIDGNRYFIEDIEKADDKIRKILDLWL